MSPIDNVEAQHELAALAAYSGDPWVPSNPYFAAAEGSAAWLWENLIYPFIKDCDFSDTVDLAAWQGRNSVFLLKYARHMTITDIQARNVERCKERFGDNPAGGVIPCRKCLWLPAFGGLVC
jgi:hypothetical protein